jgi:hypothetical protein
MGSFGIPNWATGTERRHPFDCRVVAHAMNPGPTLTAALRVSVWKVKLSLGLPGEPLRGFFCLQHRADGGHFVVVVEHEADQAAASPACGRLASHALPSAAEISVRLPIFLAISRPFLISANTVVRPMP